MAVGKDVIMMMNRVHLQQPWDHPFDANYQPLTVIEAVVSRHVQMGTPSIGATEMNDLLSN